MKRGTGGASHLNPHDLAVIAVVVAFLEDAIAARGGIAQPQLA